jgi:hypothetical protein
MRFVSRIVPGLHDGPMHPKRFEGGCTTISLLQIYDFGLRNGYDGGAVRLIFNQSSAPFSFRRTPFTFVLLPLTLFLYQYPASSPNQPINSVNYYAISLNPQSEI